MIIPFSYIPLIYNLFYPARLDPRSEEIPKHHKDQDNRIDLYGSFGNIRGANGAVGGWSSVGPSRHSRGVRSGA